MILSFVWHLYERTLHFLWPDDVVAVTHTKWRSSDVTPHGHKLAFFKRKPFCDVRFWGWFSPGSGDSGELKNMPYHECMVYLPTI